MEHMQILIEGSGRHIHVSQPDLETLFGKGFVLEEKRALSQPGQYLSGQKVDVIGPKGTLKGISILGPCRSATQVELSFTDARILGLTPPTRESGDLADSEGCTLVGPAGQVVLKEGVIIAKRHVHMTPEDAKKFGVADKEIVQVQVGGPRGLIFDQVVARVSPSYSTSMHVDYDEANAAALFGDSTGIILKKS